MKKLADRLSVVKIKKSSDVRSNISSKVQGKQTLEYDMENNAFRMIDDDDLWIYKLELWNEKYIRNISKNIKFFKSY